MVEVRWMSGQASLESEGRIKVSVITKQALKDGNVAEWLKPMVDTLERNHLFEGRLNQTYVMPLPEGASAEAVILVGGGERPLTSEDLRLSAAAAAKAAIRIQAEQVLFEVPALLSAWTVEGSSKEAAHALTEGFILGAYKPIHYRRETSAYEGVRRLTFYHEGAVVDQEAEGWKEGIASGQAFAAGTILSRDLTNLPGNLLRPEDLADTAVELAQRYGLEVEVLDESEMEERGMGGILAIGKGSVNPPRMISIKYQGRSDWDEVTGLVGKGITFDTGGISLKKAPGMADMISDMGGAASVLGVIEVLGRLRPEINVVAVIASAENMPSGSATKPGDLITTLSGRTIEMLNTDAEGRVVLADGMTYAREKGASRLLDIATLTGAVEVALGNVATGAVTNDETFLQGFIMASKQTGEKVWPLPSYPEYWDMLKSDVADLQNSPGRFGAAITAGLFIGTFAEGMPWIHLDIAGTAYLPKERGVDPKGGTGVMVRTITQWLITEK
ncbi:leucyl aminopeptidase [Paenibacillus sp. CAA11]|nr:leucyl aminopeptidase [Paenibacillus sp. CAA11]